MINRYNNKDIKIICLNIRSYSKNFNTFESYLYSQNLNNFFDVIMFNECWLGPLVHIDELCGYEKSKINSKTNKT